MPKVPGSASNAAAKPILFPCPEKLPGLAIPLLPNAEHAKLG